MSTALADPLLYQAACLEATVTLIGLGWPLFPCKPDKRPYTKAGFKDATVDRDKLSRSLTKHNDALLGAPTGQPSGFFVVDIDVDPQKGIDGSVWLKDQLERHGPLAAGPVASTRRGGRHYYFRYPEGYLIKSSAGKLAHGVDIRGDGGYVIVPPSQTDGGSWAWIMSPTEVSLPEAPEWLLALVCAPPPKDELLELEADTLPTNEDLSLTEEEIARQLVKVQGAREGSRNTTLNAAAFFCGKIVGAGVANETDVFDKLLTAAEMIGLPAEEARRTIRSGINAGKRNPWRPRAASPSLTNLNREYFFAIDGSIGLIFREEVDPLSGNRALARLKVSAFKDSLSNRSIQSGEKKVPVAVAWMSWGSRRQYEKVVFAPGQELPSHLYNQWHGFAVEPAAGDCSRFLRFMQDVICSANPANWDYLERWCARAIQLLSRQGEVAVVLRGLKGVGKSFFAHHLGEFFGDHYVTMADSRHLVGNFNAHLETAILVFADEAFWAGDKQNEGALKALITEPHIRIERKGIDSKSAPNYTHLMMASNAEWVVPASHDERRYFILDVSEEHRGDHDYFGDIEAEWQAGGREALLHHLANLDITDFNVRRPPQTEALHEQKLLSMPTVDRWFYDLLRCGGNVGGLSENLKWQEWEHTGLLYGGYCGYCQMEGARPVPRVAFGTRLNRLLPPRTDGRSPRRQRGRNRQWGYEFSSLDECRQYFDKLMGFKNDWGEEEKKLPPVPETPF